MSGAQNGMFAARVLLCFSWIVGVGVTLCTGACKGIVQAIHFPVCVLMAGQVSSFTFQRGLRGYHIYCNTWIPKKDEILSVKHEEGNPFDQYAIAAVKSDRNPGAQTEKIVGHLPNEIPRLVRFIILHGVQVSVKVVEETLDDHHSCKAALKSRSW